MLSWTVPFFYRQHFLELVINSWYILYPYSLWVPVTILVLDTNTNAILFKYKSFKTLFIRYKSLKKKLNVVSDKEKRKRESMRTKNEILWIMYFLMIIQLFNRKLPKGLWHGLFISLSSRVWIYSVWSSKVIRADLNYSSSFLNRLNWECQNSFPM